MRCEIILKANHTWTGSSWLGNLERSKSYCYCSKLMKLLRPPKIIFLFFFSHKHQCRPWIFVHVLIFIQYNWFELRSDIWYSDHPNNSSPEQGRTLSVIVRDFGDEFCYGWRKFTTSDNSPSQGFSEWSEDTIKST